MAKGEEGGQLMPFELSELRGALRQFRRDRLVSCSAVVSVALGATRAAVALLVVKRTVVVVGLGLAAAALGSLAFTRVLADFLYGVDGAQGATYVASSLVMVAAAVVAAVHPVRSALATDPAVALRHE